MTSCGITEEPAGAAAASASAVLICLTASILSVFVRNTKKYQDELSGKAFVVPNSLCVLSFPNIGEPTLVTCVGGINYKSLTE